MRRMLRRRTGVLLVVTALACCWATGDARAEATPADATPATNAAAPAPPGAGPEAAAAEPPPKLVGDPAKGATSAALCAACHGADGNAPVPMFPKLAGQRSDYVAKQLRDFKAGHRVDPMMTGMAAMLSDQDIVDVAAHFESGTVNRVPGDPVLVEAGQQIYRKGRPEIGLLPCIGCHGLNGEGANGAIDGGFPAVSGQNPAYVVKQLESFRAGSRANDWKGIMQIVASRLSDDDIAALSVYLNSLSRSSK
ncbi:MAG: cytochrome c4 [Deltaproteobacteria bacterium]|nr:cytochrome c4 [Deltaproteobacteria bacterium]MBW2402173.1 cytochrome c4 [Deltaproteobacteria bacterium]